jgi:cytochrome P450
VDFTGFDPFREPSLADPYPFFAAARAATPVFFDAALDHWVITRHADVLAVFRDPASYSAANALAPLVAVCPAASRILSDGGFRPVPTLTNNDPPAHTRVRRLANLAFTRRRVAAMAPTIRALARRFITERMSGGEVDFIRALAWELPALVVFHILGIPDEDVPAIKAGAESRLLFMWGKPTPDEQASLAQGMARFWRYAEGLVAARRADPRDDFTTALMAARDSDAPALSAQEVATIVYGLLLAGHETTTGLLGNACHRLLAEDGVWARLVAEPGLIPQAIDEVLRIDSSVIAWRRQSTQPSRIGDLDIPAGAKLLLLIGSANRDPAVFSDPERFDLNRPNARDHLSFGYGPHFCLGAPLARLEAKIVFEELCALKPALTLVPGQRLRYQPNVSFRGPLALQVRA